MPDYLGVHYVTIEYKNNPFWVVQYSDRTGNAGYSLYNGRQFMITPTRDQADAVARDLSSRSDRYESVSIFQVDYGGVFEFQKWNVGDPAAIVVNPAPFVIEPIIPLEPITEPAPDQVVPSNSINAARIGIALFAGYLLLRKK